MSRRNFGNKMSEAKEAYEAGERYRGFILYARDGEKFWVSGEERWMSEEEIDEMSAERRTAREENKLPEERWMSE